MGFRMLSLAAAVVSVVLLSGCVPGEPVVTPAPTPSSTPVFSSDEEALAAATEAYAKYLEVTDEIFQNGGAPLDGLTAVLTSDLLASTIEGFKRAKSMGLHSTGGTSFDHVELQQYDPGSAGVSIVVAYVCEDVSAVDVFDSEGASVVSPDRPERVLYEVTYDLGPDHQSLLLSNRESWSKEPC